MVEGFRTIEEYNKVAKYTKGIPWFVKKEMDEREDFMESLKSVIPCTRGRFQRQ